MVGPGSPSTGSQSATHHADQHRGAKGTGRRSHQGGAAAAACAHIHPLLPRVSGRSSLAQSARPAADAMPLALAQLQDLRERISDRLRPWSRSAQFWIRAADIYTSYKVGELAAGPFVVCLWCARRYAPVVRCGGGV